MSKARPGLRVAALLAAVAAAPLATAPLAMAQEKYPVRPVRLVLPYPPGGSTDFVAREVTAKLSEALGQQFVIDHRPGAGTVIGLGIGAKATPDGYTVVFTTSGGLVVNPALGVKTSYDPLKDFTPIGMMVNVPYVLVANANFPANNVKELIAIAKANPGKVNMSSPGYGTPNHLGGELLNYMAGVKIVHVAYKGGAAAVTDLAGGQVQIMFSGIPQVSAMLQAKRIKVIAVATEKRTDLVPDMPAIAETLPGFVCGTWYALMAPAGTPRPIVNLLSTEMGKALRDPGVMKRLASQGVESIPSGPDMVRETIIRETARWREIMTKAGISADTAQ